MLLCAHTACYNSIYLPPHRAHDDAHTACLRLASVLDTAALQRLSYVLCLCNVCCTPAPEPALALTTFPPPTAAPQKKSDSQAGDLQRTNDKLREKVAALQARPSGNSEQVAALQAEVKTLKASEAKLGDEVKVGGGRHWHSADLHCASSAASLGGTSLKACMQGLHMAAELPPAS